MSSNKAPLPPLEIQLLSAAASDSELVREIAELVNRVYAVAEEGLWIEGAARTTTSEMAKLIAAGQIAVARMDGRIVGAVRIQQLDAATGEFGMLAADPAHRGEGIGRGLVIFAEDLSRQRGLGAMQLELLVPRGWTHPTKAFLHAWYTRIGYRPVRSGTIDESYSHLAPLLATPCDLVIYRKDLAGPRPGEVPFQAHVELLHLFMAHRDEIVERIQGLLNAQRKPTEYLQDRSLLSRHFEDCFFTLSEIPHNQSRLRSQLEEAHWASGFRPRAIPGLHNGLVDPAEMMIRGFHLWRQTRWPGRNGRVRYAHTLFNLYLIRRLELLSMRLWDAGSNSAADRLSQVQAVLDELWRTTAADQPVLVRDARWLIQLAQSPATDDLGAYFEVAKQVAESLPEEDRIAIHKAGVRMAAGHLRSQIRYYSLKKAVPLDEESVVLTTRNSNALDFALLIQELVPLLEAYEDAWHSDDRRKRLELADAICQGISPDPELFLNRVELLGAYSMIEHLFITTDGDGHAVHTPMGRRHVQLLQEYEARIGRVSKPLSDDCSDFRPIAGAYSPYGVLYGFSSDLLEHMALKNLQPDAATRFGLEDVFASSDGSTGKLAWVSGWRKLPHLTPEVQKQFDYPQQFAEDVFDRIEAALRRRVSGGEADAVVPTGRLFIHPEDDRDADSKASLIPDLPVRYIGSSDMQIVAAHKAEADDEPRLLSDRREGKCILSYKTPGGWVAITKTILTEVLGAGRDVKVAGLPPVAVGVLKLMCPRLVVLPEHLPPYSGMPDTPITFDVPDGRSKV